jgi:hypothetical protein
MSRAWVVRAENGFGLRAGKADCRFRGNDDMEERLEHDELSLIML